MRGRQAADDGRLDVVTAGQVLATGEHRPIAPRLADRGLVPVDSTLVDDRAEPVGPHERVAEGDLLGLPDEPADQLVVDRPLDVDARVGRALLAAEAEG